MRRYNLLVDIGNTFVKWGRYRPASGGRAQDACIESGHALLDEIPALSAVFRGKRAPEHVLISNVAGTRVRTAMLRLLEVWPDAPAPVWVAARAEQCGVKNGYRNPSQLGADRWAAMIGARSLVGARPTLVVCCGTATTIDCLAGDGRFLGGVILPGVGLMLRSLHEGTARLPDADGQYSEHPTQTVDAIVTGCVHAQAGAVERVYQRYRREHPRLTCVVSGGAARTLAPRLGMRFRLHENLALEGLFRIAREMRSGGKLL